LSSKAGTSHWESPKYATNSSGFTALPGRTSFVDGHFDYLHAVAYIWSSSQYNATVAGEEVLEYNDRYIYLAYDHKTYGFSARCLKD
jgi:uncharacterized protein (TIGR02145 family)